MKNHSPAEPIKTGQRLLLDGHVIVTVLKSFPRSLMKCVVELPDTRFILVDQTRLTQL
ncbi:MAG TPA: hypothetical protein PK325_18280 [Cyclobacteriaceae bacterium]|nr:hypothetical protein [Cyclobacteriaceae bacterium]HMV09257.1 hypothetical protein [Cyclobacteriaceae bacterium]HMV91223.1 hypothetical protein [Cyclobacteriaceae bacterium]HMX01943.1 hypothetical protein [Cyclobacteriaceae bacterium]HMX51956.1 hypothetical protein [Cyclobacteriaceae bacterium]